MTRELVITADGSSSVFIADLDEHYHSIHGALQESKHVFINAGLNYKINKQNVISVLEIGFGTGLNALLTCLEANAHHQRVDYLTIEKYPLSTDLYSQLNYCNFIDNENCGDFFDKINSSSWEEKNVISEYFKIIKRKQNIEDCIFFDQFDIIYFDAFAPSAQPELWTASVLKKMYEALKKDGILVTYCAKGIVKRTLRDIGFRIEALSGPIGKREMTRASKTAVFL